MAHFNFNGKLYEANATIIGADNRGLRYGDGLFETIRSKNENLILLDEHLARLWNGLKFLQFEIPKLFSPDSIEKQIRQLLQKNKHDHARIRLSVIRGGGGLYDPKNLFPHHIIQTWPLPFEANQLNENGLQLCIYRDSKKSIDKFSNIKHNNFLPYVMGAFYAKSQRCNDAILLNQHNRICDSTIANVFLVDKGTVYTPALEEGCIAGVMRAEVIRILKENNIPVVESTLNEEALQAADELFLTNSIFNIRWVAAIGNKTYGSDFVRQMLQLLQQTNPLVFC